MYSQSMFNIENINCLLVKFSIFTAEKNLSILHGRVFVMSIVETNIQVQMRICKLQ